MKTKCLCGCVMSRVRGETAGNATCFFHGPLLFLSPRTFFRPHKVTKSVHLPCPTGRRQHQGLIGVPGGCQAQGAASADRPGPRAAQARRDCTPPQVGVPAATRRWRAAQRVPAGRAQQPGHLQGPVPGEQAEPGGCCGAETTQQQQPSSARVHVGSRLSLSSPGNGADDGGIYGLAASHAKG